MKGFHIVSVVFLLMASAGASAQTWKLVSPGTGSGGTQDCTTGQIGTICADNNSVFVGLNAAGVRIYAYIVDENGATTWKTDSTESPGTESQTDGMANTYAMNNASHPAAQKCATKEPAGTWYLPSIDELQAMYSARLILEKTGTNLALTTHYSSSSQDPANIARYQRLYITEAGGASITLQGKGGASIIRCMRH